jgi:HK97 family phage prohead protease
MKTLNMTATHNEWLIIMNHLTIPLELKSLDQAGRFAGYASLFGNVDNQKDRVEPGAFQQSLVKKAGDIKLLWQHHMDEPIGQIEALYEDERGLYMEGRLMLTLQRGREAYELIKAGALKGLSIGYRPITYRIDPQTGIRHLQQVDLFEISVVTFPANDAAEITVVKSEEGFAPSQLVGLSEALGSALERLK